MRCPFHITKWSLSPLHLHLSRKKKKKERKRDQSVASHPHRARNISGLSDVTFYSACRNGTRVYFHQAVFFGEVCTFKAVLETTLTQRKRLNKAQ